MAERGVGSNSIQRRLSFDASTKHRMGYSGDMDTRGLVDALDNPRPISRYPATPGQWSTRSPSTHPGMTTSPGDPSSFQLHRRPSSLDTFHQVGWLPITASERRRSASGSSLSTASLDNELGAPRAAHNTLTAWHDRGKEGVAADTANVSVSDIRTVDKDLEMAFAYLPKAYKPYYSDPRGAVTYVISNPRNEETVTKTVVIDENKELRVYDGVPEGITPDATVRVRKSDFLNCVNSTLDPFVAYMVGKVKVDNVNQIRIFGNNFEFDEDDFTTFQNEWREAQDVDEVSASRRGSVEGDDDDDDTDGEDGGRFRSWSSGFQRLRSRSLSVSEDIPDILEADSVAASEDSPTWAVDDPRSPFFHDRSLSRVQEALTDSLDHLRTEVLDLATQDLDKRQAEVKESLQALRDNAEVMQRELVDRATGDAKEMEQLLRKKWSEAVGTIRREIVVKAQKDSRDIQKRFREGMQEIVREIKQEVSESTRDNAEAKEFIAGMAQSWHQKVKDTALDAANTTKFTSSSLLQYFDQKASSMREDPLSSPDVNTPVMITLPKPAPADSLKQRVTITPSFLKDMLGKPEKYQQRSEVQVTSAGVVSPAPYVRELVTSPEGAPEPPKRARLSLDETTAFLQDLRELAGQGATDFKSAISTCVDKFNLFLKTAGTSAPMDPSLQSDRHAGPVMSRGGQPRAPGVGRDARTEPTLVKNHNDGSSTGLDGDSLGLGPMRR
eukprot:TRINITY_DN2562_c0_g1_i1.p1 TRINITY_DN2562_c0_g1~~TRINITY_DN2562_c0_g1_i1.p1  ORF type:complete len:725 (-),score=90.64 TRINITY_DN2562_c0_g1_i1:711-2885(-)